MKRSFDVTNPTQFERSTSAAAVTDIRSILAMTSATGYLIHLPEWCHSTGYGLTSTQIHGLTGRDGRHFSMIVERRLEVRQGHGTLSAMTVQPLRYGNF